MQSFLKTITKWLAESEPQAVVYRQQAPFSSSYLQRTVLVDLYIPPGYTEHPNRHYPVLLFNDGQDLLRMDFVQILENLIKRHRIPPLIVAGMHASEKRIREYGTAARPDYKGRGDLALEYSKFVLKELMPFLKTHFRISDRASDTFFAGFSLGALSAIDIAWAHPELFGGAGVFSGALWWRSQAVDPADPDASRIMHHIVEHSGYCDKNQRFWFQCGTLDETDDRNNNGVIDAIDDTLDLIKALKIRGIPQENIRYLEVPEGRHEPSTWAEAMPDFLEWVLASK